MSDSVYYRSGASEKLSKFLSFVLRHRPESIGVALDEAGWVAIDVLIEQCKVHGTFITSGLLDEIVKNDAKGRYGISEDGLKIRANQGHSLASVDIAFKKAIPPVQLFHGTPESSVAVIMRKGLLKMKRHHVHMSATHEAAVEVGKRRGSPVVLVIDAASMVKDKIDFFISENGVWLTDEVPAKYLSLPKQ